MERKIKICKTVVCFIVLAICGKYGVFHADPAMAAQLVLEKDSVKVGKQISFEGKLDGYSFKSSNEQTAYVSGKGVITGKRKGSVTITAVKEREKLQFPITVKADGKKPAIKVCRDELLVKEPFVFPKDGNNVIVFTVESQSKKGVVDRLECRFRCTALCKSVGNTITAEKTVTIHFGRIRPGENVLAYCTEMEGIVNLQKATLEMVTVYNGKAKFSWNEKLSSSNGNDSETDNPNEPDNPDEPDNPSEPDNPDEPDNPSEPDEPDNPDEPDEPDNPDEPQKPGKPRDKKPPVIKGFIGKKSYNGQDVFVTLYADRKTAYKKYVTAYDKHDGKVPVKADLSKINWNKNGIYTVTVTAKDAAGNQAKRKMRVQVRCLKGIDLYADKILKKITKSGWSDKVKCQAIYSYMQSHMRYVNYNGGKSWTSAALRGLRYGNGNCYAYYSLSRLLLTRAGIPNLMVTRYPAVPNHHHWWNLAYVKGGWYHFDTTPRRLRGRFCLLTDAQLGKYESRSPGTYRYQSSRYPKRAGKVICGGPF